MDVIVGNGAVGLGLSELLVRSGIKNTVLGRKDPVIKGGKRYWITTKAYDLESALIGLQNADIKNAHIVLLSNGYHFDLARSYQKRFLLNQIWIGAAYFGSRFEQDSLSNQRVLLTGDQGICVRIGCIPNEKVNDSFQPPDFCELSAEIDAVLREKWFFNTIINSICGAYRLPRNGLLSQYKELVDQVSEEAFSLGEEIFGKWPHAKKDLQNDLAKIIEKSAFNENSMARDVRFGRLTETKFFAGLAVGRVGYPVLKILNGVLER